MQGIEEEQERNALKVSKIKEGYERNANRSAQETEMKVKEVGHELRFVITKT